MFRDRTERSAVMFKDGGAYHYRRNEYDQNAWRLTILNGNLRNFTLNAKWRE